MKLFQSSARYYGGRLVMMISMEWEGQGGGGGGPGAEPFICCVAGSLRPFMS